MSSAIPKWRKTCWNRVSAVSKAVGSPFGGMSLHALENRLTMIRIQVLESDGGRSEIKSTPKGSLHRAHDHGWREDGFRWTAFWFREMEMR